MQVEPVGQAILHEICSLISKAAFRHLLVPFPSDYDSPITALQERICYFDNCICHQKWNCLHGFVGWYQLYVSMCPVAATHTTNIFYNVYVPDRQVQQAKKGNCQAPCELNILSFTHRIYIIVPSCEITPLYMNIAIHTTGQISRSADVISISSVN